METKIRELAKFSICDEFNSDRIYTTLTDLKLSDDAVEKILEMLYIMSYCAYAQGLVNVYAVVKNECLDKEFTKHIMSLVNTTIEKIETSDDQDALNDFLYVYNQYKNIAEMFENQPLQ